MSDEFSHAPPASRALRGTRNVHSELSYSTPPPDGWHDHKAQSSMTIHNDILAYNKAHSQRDRRICDALAKLIDQHLPGAEAEIENKIWHCHPVWFIDGNPIVAYSRLRSPQPDGCIRMLFWSGQSFDEPGLVAEGSFKAAEARFTDVDQINKKALKRWLKKAAAIQWDYKNIVKRKGKLLRLK